jgi:hypothetical protein
MGGENAPSKHANAAFMCVRRSANSGVPRPWFSGLKGDPSRVKGRWLLVAFVFATNQHSDAF